MFLALFAGKSASKIFGLFPVVGMFREDGKERWYYTLMMSTGLTFGTISALYGLTHGIVTQQQYSFLVAVVIASAVIPTMIANVAFLPRHLLPAVPLANEDVPQLEAASAGMAMDCPDGLARQVKAAQPCSGCTSGQSAEPLFVSPVNSAETFHPITVPDTFPTTLPTRCDRAAYLRRQRN